MTEPNHICQYGTCEDPPHYRIGTITANVPGSYQELLVCDYHLDLMRKSVSVRIISQTRV